MLACNIPAMHLNKVSVIAASVMLMHPRFYKRGNRRRTVVGIGNGTCARQSADVLTKTCLSADTPTRI